MIVERESYETIRYDVCEGCCVVVIRGVDGDGDRHTSVKLINEEYRTGTSFFGAPTERIVEREVRIPFGEEVEDLRALDNLIDALKEVRRMALGDN